MSEPVNPDDLINGYEQRLAQAQEKSERIRADLDGVQVTERSPGGATVTVNATGNPQKIDVSDALAQRGGAAVSSEIMRALSTAQAKIATRVQQAMEPYLGGTEAMERTVSQLRSARPVEDQHGKPPAEQTYGSLRFDSPPPPPPPARPRRPRPPADDDDDDFGGPIMRR